MILYRFKLMLFLLLTQVYAKDYILEYNGLSVGTIININTINDGYLVAKFDNPVAYVLNGFKDYYVFYKEGNIPHIEDAKLKLDKQNFIDSVAWLISNPTTKKLQITEKRVLDVECISKDYCSWDYYYKNEHRRKGYVRFKDGIFVEYNDITQNIKIIESK